MQRQQFAAAMLLCVAQVCVTPTVLLGPSCLRPSQQHVAVTAFQDVTRCRTLLGVVFWMGQVV